MADGRVLIDTSLDTSKLNKQVNTLKGNLSRGLQSVAKAGAIALTGMTVAIGAIATASVKIATTADRVDKLSQKIGISREAFQEWDFILSQSGASVEGLQMSIKTLSNAASEAAQGTAEYKDEFDRLGISVRDTNGQMKSQEQLFNEVFGALSNMKDETQRTATASKLLGRSATELAPAMNAGADGIEEMRSNAHDLGLVMGDEVVDAGVMLTDSIDQLKRVGTALMVNFVGPIIPLVNEVVQGFIGIATGAEGAAQALGETMGGAIQTMLDRLTNALPSILSAGVNIVISIAKGILTGLPKMVEELAYLVGFGIGYLVERLPDFLQQGLEFVVSLASGIVQGIPDVLDKIGGLVVSALNWLSENLPGFIESGRELIINLINGIGEKAPEAISKISEIVGNILSWLMENAPSLIAGGLELVLNILKGIVDNIPQIVGAIKNMLGSLISTIVENGPAFLEKGKEVITNFWNGLKEIFGPVLSSIASLMVDIGKAIADKAVDIYNKAKTTFGMVVTAIASKSKDIYNKAKDGVGNIVTAIVDKAVDIFNSAKDIGKNLIDGFVQGFEALKDAAKKKVTGFFDGVVGGVKSLLGIASPSKVFKEIGSNTAQGFSDGLEDGKTGVMRTADSLGYEAIDAVEAYQPDAVQAGVDLGDGVKDGIASTKGSIADQWNEILDGMNERTQTIVEMMKSSLTSTLASFSAIGEALYNGELGWQDFAKIGLQALSDILMAIGHQLAAMAALEFVKLNWVGGGLAAAGAAAAYTAAGLVDAWANSYDVGGIIKQDQLANIHRGETILPAGISADMRSAGLEIRPLGGGARDIVVNGVLEVDGRRLAKAVFRYTDENVGLSYV